ncbi:chemokine-like protein TAFA-5 isoform X1 [Stigmatopora argus]
MQLYRLLLPLSAAGVCWFLLCALHGHGIRQGTASSRAHARAHGRESTGHLWTGSCEIVTLEHYGSRPRRNIARQTARCACIEGQTAGTIRGRPACVRAEIVLSRQWCEMSPCLDDEGCDLLVNQSGWTCTQPGGRVKTTTVS